MRQVLAICELCKQMGSKVRIGQILCATLMVTFDTYSIRLNTKWCENIDGKTGWGVCVCMCVCFFFFFSDICWFH